MWKTLLRVFRSLLIRSSYADRIRELEIAFALSTLWEFDLRNMANRYQSLLSKLQLHQCLEFALTRVGSEYDGGYVLCSNFDNILSVLSLGIGGNSDFEMDFAKLGKNVALYDGTIKQLPSSHPNFSFVRSNVYGNVSSKVGSVRCMHIDEVINSHFGFSLNSCNSDYISDAVLKMDIEGHEYEVILAMKESQLNLFQQIAIEFHNIHSELRNNQEMLHECFGKLQKTHELISIHANNFGGCIKYGSAEYPDVIETTWMRRNCATFAKIKNSFTSELSSPNNPRRPEIILEW